MLAQILAFVNRSPPKRRLKRDLATTFGVGKAVGQYGRTGANSTVTTAEPAARRVRGVERHNRGRVAREAGVGDGGIGGPSGEP
ncbi:hypothetical protein [Nonomuraea guangzhouensis]|uniref:Uncharacterized protein n=1 Tax=Nonomuraea guangzhouensis TaxID=1291555 RepID=A0ABW4GEQ2_9ACTN|nr:hypothetical protein [Nonomuraea guangzhouensis]